MITRKEAFTMPAIVRFLFVAFFFWAKLYPRTPERTVAYTCVNKPGDASLPYAIGEWYTKEVVFDKRRDRLGYWCKVRGALEMMDAGYKTIMYFDSDFVADFRKLYKIAGTGRLSMPLHAGGSELIKTNMFILGNRTENYEMMLKWYAQRYNYTRHPHDQAAMNAMIRNVTIRPATFDPTGMEIAHCSSHLDLGRRKCMENMKSLRWTHEVLTGLFYQANRLFWPVVLITPFLGIPIPNIASLTRIHVLNPVAWAILFTVLPNVLSFEVMTPNQGLIQMYHRNITKIPYFPFVYWVPGLHLTIIPGIGLVDVLEALKVQAVNVALIAFGLLSAYMAEKIGREIAMPFVYPSFLHMIAYAQGNKSKQTDLTGNGKWLGLHGDKLERRIKLTREHSRALRFSNWNDVCHSDGE